MNAEECASRLEESANWIETEFIPALEQMGMSRHSLAQITNRLAIRRRRYLARKLRSGRQPSERLIRSLTPDESGEDLRQFQRGMARLHRHIAAVDRFLYRLILAEVIVLLAVAIAAMLAWRR